MPPRIRASTGLLPSLPPVSTNRHSSRACDRFRRVAALRRGWGPPQTSPILLAESLLRKFKLSSRYNIHLPGNFYTILERFGIIDANIKIFKENV